MKKLLSRFPIPLTIILIFGLTFHCLGKPSQAISQIPGVNATRAKARYYYLQAAEAAANGKMDIAYEYYRKAYYDDPSLLDAAFNYGSHRLLLRTDTMQSDTELDRSLAIMQRYVDAYPADLNAVRMYGYVTSALDTVEESIRVYENAYSLMPRETQLLLMLSDAYIRSYDSKKALDALKRYEKIEGKSKDITLKKITFMMAENDTVAALSEAQSLVDSNPADPFNYIIQGNLYQVIGQPDSVLVTYKKAEAIAPESGAVKMSLAQYYREQGDSVMLDAMIYEALLAEDFELEDKLGILGEYLQKLLDEKGDRSRGDHLFSILQEQYPHETPVLEMSARYAAAKGDFDQAVEAISYAIDLDPTNEQYHLMLLSFDLTDSKYQQAVSDYQNALQHIQPSIPLKNLYAAAASMLDDTEEAKNILHQLLLDTDSAMDSAEGRDKVRKKLNYDELKMISSIYCMLGDINYKAGDLKQAFDDYEISLYFFPDNALTLNNYAYFLSEADTDLEKAKKMSRRSLELSENNPTYLDTYAWILYKLGDYNEAKEYMELALELAKQQDDENEEYTHHYEEIMKKVNQE